MGSLLSQYVFKTKLVKLQARYSAKVASIARNKDQIVVERSGGY
jgi:hypothetical protein